MAAEPGMLDFRFLRDATAKLLGYFVCTWFTHYLGVVAHALGRLEDSGLIRGWAEPTELGTYSVPFDFKSLNSEKLSYICGIYFYVLSCHKAANYRLMNRSENKRILLLRGYDYEFSISAGAGQAASVGSLDTARFGWTVDEHIAPHFHVFKVMSGKDVYWGTVDAQNYFRWDFGGVARHGNRPTRSIYMNSGCWKEDLAYLLDRMDHYLVYVSSITESLLWELSQLDTDSRRDRVTIVFDQAAIENKETHRYLFERMRDESDWLIWQGSGQPPVSTPSELRESLSRTFLLITPEEFERDIETHRKRMATHSGAMGPGARESWVDFRFYPALDGPDMATLRCLSALAGAYVARPREGRAITCLPLYFCQVQLRIFLTLLLGEHSETGRALAAYAAVMHGALDYFRREEIRMGSLSGEDRERHLRLLDDHLEGARHMGFHMLAYGKSHEFGDYTEAADADFDAIFAATLPAVAAYLETTAARNPA